MGPILSNSTRSLYNIYFLRALEISKGPHCSSEITQESILPKQMVFNSALSRIGSPRTRRHSCPCCEEYNSSIGYPRLLVRLQASLSTPCASPVYKFKRLHRDSSLEVSSNWHISGPCSSGILPDYSERGVGCVWVSASGWRNRLLSSLVF
ncbi:hypothetical protein AAHA92_22247 [Salvia divinorum]|uniref:Uncharacterized protein n=1 Tax=Salvia divinorum TaxID=28513 RepID=A0ABD1GN25_SALDI